jgi:hypothetical protein
MRLFGSMSELQALYADPILVFHIAAQRSSHHPDMFTDSALPLLAPHLPVLLGSAAFFWAVQLGTHVVAPRIAGRVGDKWRGWDGRTRKGFASHVVCKCLL